MAYGLKYTQWVGQGGSRVLIRVYVKDWTGASYGMAHITGASLQIVGGQSDILAPVIKTAFSFSLVDAWDEGSTAADGTECVNAMNEKCGRWEEFFTPDATKFRVEVSAAPAGAMPSVIWTGFVTPDSWSENLIYHGSVTITARDMLGALQDAEFNLTGRVSVLDIVQGALSACACPMGLSYTAGHFLAHESGVSLLRHNIGALTFSGNTWMTALDDTLESLGLALRWNGRNEVVLTSYRYLEDDTQAGFHAMEFINRTGLRELAAALKSVTDTFNVEIEAIDAPDPAAGDFTQTGQTMTQRQQAGSSTPKDVTIPVYSLDAPASGGWGGFLAVPRPAHLGQGVPDRAMYFPTDITTGNIYATYIDPGIAAPMTIRIEQEGPVLEYILNSGGNTLTAEPSFWKHSVVSYEVQVSCTKDGVLYYFTGGGWGTTQQTIIIEPGTDVEVTPLVGGTGFAFVLWKINTLNEMGVTTVGTSTFYCVALRVTFDAPTTATTPTEYKTTTIYNEANNVTIARSPKIGSATAPMSADFCINLLGYGNEIVADAWNWPGEEDSYPLAVMIQAQIVCYYSAPASVFTGTARDGEQALPGWGLEYYGRECLLVSGTYDFASGFIGQLNAREVYTWEAVWGDSFAPEYTTKQGVGPGSTSDTGNWGGGAVESTAGAFSLDFSNDFSVTE